ncbi:glycosyltransferase family 2 protein [Bacillus cereus]|uniref:glycosyltransferase family 2 protein n=1 Tax=Bacillus cereus TaxID=1396 RepID=UPI000BF74EB7|nr:glycosyltransferase family 2 protein [Bacillus cereus]PEX88716.1 glycosyl transferase family 2 [Bacillus cereus]
MTKKEIVILLSTYNGEKFLSQQLDSLINQTYKEWLCLVRDDGSSDSTIDILNTYASKYPERFLIIDNMNQNLRPCKSFMQLLDSAPLATYFMFCDQDDVWEKRKIELTMKEMKKAEDRYGDGTPILVHSDLEVVDENLELLAKSMKSLRKSNCEFNTINNLLLQNNVTGCTVMINSKLKEKVSRLPEKAIMHDWWLSLIASCFGKIIYIEETLIKYRQHSNNSVGAKAFGPANILEKVIKLNSANVMAKYISYVNSIIEQSREFLNIYEEQLKLEDREVLVAIKKLERENYLQRMRILNKFNINAQNYITGLLYKIILVFSSRVYDGDKKCS